MFNGCSSFRWTQSEENKEREKETQKREKEDHRWRLPAVPSSAIWSGSHLQKHQHTLHSFNTQIRQAHAGTQHTQRTTATTPNTRHTGIRTQALRVAEHLELLPCVFLLGSMFLVSLYSFIFVGLAGIDMATIALG
jgi:hypothetical protein